MLDKICSILINKMKQEIPEMSREKEEEIRYGLELMIGEIPKVLIMFLIAYILGVLELSILSYIILLPYKFVSGGVHAKTHLACIIGTPTIYCGTVYLSKYLNIQPFELRLAFIFATWIFGMIMITLYAPADTENVPILRKKERTQKKILSYIVLTINLIVAILIKDSVISNILIYGSLVQSILISRIAFKIFNNQYGHEVYEN